MTMNVIANFFLVRMLQYVSAVRSEITKWQSKSRTFKVRQMLRMLVKQDCAFGSETQRRGSLGQ